MPKCSSESAYRLIHEGSLALSKVESAGIRINTKYLDATITEIQDRIRGIESDMKKGSIWKAWEKKYGPSQKVERPKLGKLLFEDLGYKVHDYTEKSKELVRGSWRAKMDKTALERIKHPFVKSFLEVEGLKKVLSTYMIGLKREAVQHGKDYWCVHPSYSLNIASTFRSTCVAKGSLIEVVRDVSKFPKGIPIEDVRAGDQVYCYNKHGRLTIREVEWAGKTGHKRVIRIHWNARGKHGYLDVTPDHRVRLASGKFIRADELHPGQDFRMKGESRRNPNVRVSAMGRTGDKIYETGNNVALWDHRLVYRKLVGKLNKKDHVHHKDENHLNNNPKNLKRMTASDHAKHHGSITDDVRRLGVKQRQKNHQLYGDRWPSGQDNPNWKELSKFQILRMLSSVGGKVSRIKEMMDFNTFKTKAELAGVDLKKVKERYDVHGRYLSIQRVKRAARKGIRYMQRKFGVAYYKAKRIADERGIEIRTANNHRITAVEYLDKKVDVYDLTVQGCHNYIANELCVHNCSDPNFQNQPKRNEEMYNLVRQCYLPHPGHHLVEIDFSTLEVKVAYFYHQDPVMRKYLTDKSTDMHRDMAMKLFMLEQHQVEKKTTRDSAKNQFVFPEFYGSVYFQCAKNIWERLKRDKWDISGEQSVSVKDHLKSKGITKLGDCDPQKDAVPGTFEWHVQRVEKELWETFSVYSKWKQKVFEDYQRTGSLEMLTGFVVNTGLKRNEAINYPVQGSAFHCLLWSLTSMVNWIDKYKMKSHIIGQVHDSLVCSVHPRELQDFLHHAKWVMTYLLPRHWPWITIPLDTESDVAPVDADWTQQKLWIECPIHGDWRLAP